MNQQVTEYIENIEQAWQNERCAQIRQLIRQAVPDVKEEYKYKQPFYSKNGKQLCVFFTAKGWVNVTLFNAAALEAPQGFFEPSDQQERKTWKIRPDQTIDEAQFSGWLKQIAEAL